MAAAHSLVHDFVAVGFNVQAGGKQPSDHGGH